MLLVALQGGAVLVTVTSVTPNEGRPGGRNLVLIAGTGFDGDTQKMRVEFGGVPADRVRVRDGLSPDPNIPVFNLGTLLDCRVPPSALTTDGSVLVEVFNDATSEQGSKADAYTFARPQLADKPHILLVMIQLMTELKRDVLEEVLTVPALDWGRPDAIKAAIAADASIVIEGPRMQESTLPLDYVEIATDDDALFTWEAQRETSRYDLEFDITIVTRGKSGGLHQALSLARWVDDFMKRTPRLAVPDVEGSSNKCDYLLATVTSWQPLDVPGTDLFGYSSTVRVEGVGVQVGESIDEGVQFQTDPFTTPTLRVSAIIPAPC